jgi:4-diphosphocytidyl-2-C-methyl-D-erythritol kinase
MPTAHHSHPDRTIRLSCPAKVNLALSVGSPRPDGLHPLASWMAAVNFADTLTLHRLDAGTSRFDIAPAGSAAPAAQPQGPQHPAVTVNWPIEQDLVYRAHGLLEKHLHRPLPVHATLQKRIPTGAGLGGGSSDAAGMLVGLNRLFELGLQRDELLPLALRVGSDVGFFIGAMLGEPSALVTGVGERVEPLPLPDTLHLVLIFPPFDCPTGQVYRALDQSRSEHHTPIFPDESRVRDLATHAPLPPAAPFNDLADPACTVQPQLRRWIDQLNQQMRVPVHVTGSGSTLFLIAPSAATCQALARKVTALTGLPALPVHTL